MAALRDRTTALLSGLTPRPVIVPPAYQLLRDRQSRRLAIAIWRARLQRAGLWAAGVVAAVGAGWAARSALDPHRVAMAPPVLAEAPATSAPAATPAATSVDPTAELERQAAPAPIPQRAPLAPARQASNRFQALIPAPTLQLASMVTPVRVAPAAQTMLAAGTPTDGPFSRVWRVVPWEDALRIAGSGIPFIEGIPVVGVMLQPGAPGERPTVIVAQQDQNGEVIQSIEGPVAKVNELLARQATPDMHSSDAARTPPDYSEQPGGGVRRTLRILTVTGRLPVDSLNALARVATIR